MGRQVDLAAHQPILWFCVKFYTPDPAQLEDEFTRYLFALQVKRDLSQGHLQCNDNTAALMASYIIQGEFAGHGRMGRLEADGRTDGRTGGQTRARTGRRIG